MDTNVFANDCEICSKAADGQSASAFPDPCWSPPPPKAGPVVIPYVNAAKAPDLENGSQTVFVCNQPIALRDQSYLGTSTGNAAATRAFDQGVKSRVIEGKAYFVDWSPNVKVEGLNVCRHGDPMTHNHN